MLEDDFIQRQIQQISQALVRLVGAIAEARTDDEALEALDRGYEDCFGLPRQLLDRVAEPSLVLTLGTVDRLTTYAWLLDHQAELRTQRGDLAQAARLRARAQRVAALARALG